MAAGVPVSLNATLSRLNADHFQDLIEVARSLGVRRLGFRGWCPRARGAACWTRC